jgi:hypothetical protein
MRSSLSRHQPRTPTDETEIRALRRKAWLEQEIAVLPLAEIRDDWTRQAVKNEATRLYGKSLTVR